MNIRAFIVCVLSTAGAIQIANAQAQVAPAIPADAPQAVQLAPHPQASASLPAQTDAQPPKDAAQDASAKPESAAPAPAPAVVAYAPQPSHHIEPFNHVQDGASTRSVQYHMQDIVAIHAHVGYTSLIVLPTSEEVMDAAVGDRDFWTVDIVHNFLFIHPAKEGLSSNLNVISNHGTVYSFMLKDVSGTDTPIDLKVLVQPSDQSLLASSNGPARFLPAELVESARAMALGAKKEAVDAVEAYKSAYPSKLVIDYKFQRGKKPFFIDEIYHDDQFSYIKVDSRNQEKFAVYEIRDGKPDLVTYDYQNGVYIITHIVEKGYVRIGKQRMDFERKK
jgi:type IV secretory pathway VirB9-like protein